MNCSVIFHFSENIKISYPRESVFPNRGFQYHPNPDSNLPPLAPALIYQGNGFKQYDYGGEMPFTCPLCGKGFLSRGGLHHHTLAHGGRKFVCPICDFKFKQKSHLKTHLQKVHKLSQCQICSMTFPVGSEFNQHMLKCG